MKRTATVVGNVALEVATARAASYSCSSECQVKIFLLNPTVDFFPIERVRADRLGSSQPLSRHVEPWQAYYRATCDPPHEWLCSEKCATFRIFQCRYLSKLGRPIVRGTCCSHCLGRSCCSLPQATRDRIAAEPAPPHIASGLPPNTTHITDNFFNSSPFLFAFLKEAIDRFDKRRHILWLPQENIRSRFAGGSLYRTRRQHYHRCATAVVQFTSALYDL